MFIPRFRNSLKAILLALMLFSAKPAAAGTERAVLVGIDKYRPATAAEIKAAEPVLLRLGMAQPEDAPAHRNWDPLYGSVNDVTGIYDLLVHRYAFQPANIVTLKDEQATRQTILDNLRRVFIDQAQDGDTLVFYFSGHGSQMRNSLSADKADKMDETIVPWDANVGYWDIRDKELARIFNEALDEHPHVIITAIFDSCHSGSIARGLPAHVSLRSESPDDRDAKDPYDAPPPETRGALILSAAQYDEVAEEMDDESTKPPATHGVFTLALMQALQAANSATPAVDLFRMTRAKIHALGGEFSQEPVIAGSDARLHEGLFGPSSAKDAKTYVTVLAALRDSGGFRIDGGYALGIQPGALLQSLPTATSPQPVQLSVETVDGMSQATAVVKDPNDFSKIHAGDVLEVSKWAFPAGTKLDVWIPPANLSAPEIAAAAAEFAKIALDPAVQWVSDPTEVTPTHVIAWNGKSWELRSQSEVSDLGPQPSSASVLRALRAAEAPLKKRVFLFLPPSSELESKLPIEQGADDAIGVSKPEAGAQYWLVGSVKSAALRYTWVLPNAIRDSQSDNPLPARADWIDLNATAPASVADGLAGEITKIAKVSAWMKLAAPPDTQPYPYHLVIRNSSSSKVISGADLDPATGGMGIQGRQIRLSRVRQGETYDLILKADPNAFSDYIPTRKAYVFGIDSDGKLALLFPRNDADDQTNRLPPDAKPPDGCSSPDTSALAQQEPYSEICVRTIRVTPPLGVDTFFLLTTDEPIGDLSVFNGEPVESSQTRGANPLADLLSQVGSNHQMRGGVDPENWSIEHISVSSVPAMQNATPTAPTN